MKKLMITTMCACLAMTALAKDSEIPGTNGIEDLTKGGRMSRMNVKWAGPLGIMCGVWRPHHRQKMEDARQFQVMSIVKGSPADGVLKFHDVILGADGTGAANVPLFKGASSAMAEVGDAIAEAEAHDPAILKLLIWRPEKTDDKVDPYKRRGKSEAAATLKSYTKGKTMTVAVKLETLGRYSDTAPYNCEKSKNILRKGIKALYESNNPGRFKLGLLCLLAADDPTNPDNDKYQAKAKEWAHSMIVTKKAGAGAGWFGAGELIVLSEYYLKTKDEAVFPELEMRALSLARGVSWFGTFGHRSASRKPDGSYGGRIGGYGPINGAGTKGFLGLSLARKAGVKNPEVDAAIERQRIFFGHFAFHGGIGYGEMPYAIAGGQGDTNGKHSMTALALGLQDKQEEKAKYFSKMAALSTVESRLYAHGGPFFGQVWQPVAAAQGGVKSAHLQFNEIRWHLDLKRSWNHSYIYDPGNNKYPGFCYPAHSLLFYALPLKQLYVTGRGQKESLKLSDAEFKELQAIKTFDPRKANTKELFAELSRHQGMTRTKVAKELRARIWKDPESAESKAIVDQLIALAADSTATKSGRAGAFTTLMFLKKKSGDVNNPQDLKIVKAMVSQLKDSDPYIRFGAIRMMQAFNRHFSSVAIQPYANAFLDAIIATDRPTFPLDEENPVRWAHGEMCSFVFGTVLLGSLKGVDRKKMVAAIRSSLQTPNGNNRYFASRILDKLTKEEVLAVADILIDNTKIPPPANSMGGSAIINTQRVLAKHRFEEALPLSFFYSPGTALKYNIHKRYGQAAFDMQSTPELMETFADLMLASAVFDAKKVNEELMKTPAPDGLSQLKRIDSVKASASSLTLPTATTELVVDATNYGCREDETTYTWRKVYGAGKVAFTPNASGKSKTTTVSFTDKKPGKYRFEVAMADTLGYTLIRETVDVTLLGKKGFFSSEGKLPANKPPKATSQSLEAVPGLALPVTLTGTDPDGDDLGFIVTQAPAHGRLGGVGGNLTYTPKFGYNGTDTLTFKAIDGQGKTAAGKVEFKVSDKNVGVAVYEGFDYPTGPLHNQKGGTSFGFSGPWVNNTGNPAEQYPIKEASVSYSAIPSTGGHLLKGGGSCSRKLDRDLLKRLNMLEPGGEMWFSFFFTGVSPSRVRFSAREGAFFGAELSNKNRAKSAVRATIHPHTEGGFNRSGWSRSYGLRFPKGPNMVVVRCVWGKTDADPDTVELYRVFNAPGYDIVLTKKPVSVVKGLIPQESIEALILDISAKWEWPMDEIRVGPTRHSVMVGTKPLDVPAK